MAEEGFLARWARRKTESRVAGGASPDEPHVPPPQVAHPIVPEVQAPNAAAQAEAAARPLPSMEDVARLTPDADFSAFVARGVDPAVRRGALKKLFADPHFNTMDGLDIYIDDYTKPSPVSAAMLASLTHAKRVLQPLLNEEQPARHERPAGQDTDAAVAPDAVPEPVPEPMPESIPESTSVPDADAEPDADPAAPAADPAPRHTTTSERETQETQ